jgi:hypothetical protein
MKGERITRKVYRQQQARIAHLKITRPDIDWDYVIEYFESKFGKQQIIPDKKTKRRRPEQIAIYLMSSSPEGATKVGVATDVYRRLAEVQTGYPYRLSLGCVIWFNAPEPAFEAEQWLLREVDSSTRLVGEWINQPVATLAEKLRNYVDRHLARFVIVLSDDAEGPLGSD